MIEGKDLYRRYRPSDCITFRKTNEAFGGLSNMASGFVLWVNGTRILTSEALYQACRFPHLPEVQRSIIMQGSPMTAKMKSKPFRDQSRADWDQVRVKIMRWCLRVKLAHNWEAFGELLLRTGDKPIVEDSRKDRFWGAVMNEQGLLEGRNALGRLLMELREELKGPNKEALRSVAPLDIPDFLLYGQPIGPVEAPMPKPVPADGERRLKPLGTRRPDEPVKVYAQPARKPDLFSEPQANVEVKKTEKPPPLPPYPAYKPTAIPWLPQVPEHWEVERAKGLFMKVERPVRPEDDVVTCFRDGTVTLRKNRRSTGYTESLKEIGYQGIRKGDLVIHVMDAFAGSVGVSDSDGKSTPVYSVCVPRGDAQPWYYTYVLREMARAGWILALAKGIRERSSDFRFDMFGAQLLPVPPVAEQHLIVRYLRALDAKVKRYIRTKRKLIAALQEQKQAIIQRAVTRGVDPNVKLKPSGVEWLGEVPEHWEVRRSKTLFSERKELARPSDIQLSATQAYGVIPQDEFEARVGRRVVKISMHLEKRKHVELDDFVISMRSFQGGLERAWATGAIRSSYVILKPLAEVDVDYFTYVLKAPGYIKALQSTADFIRDGQDLNFADFSKVPLPLPPRDEQRGIALHIRKALISTEEALTRVAREIDLIQEYHTRLIADVVTGAVDVREAARKLPEEDQMIRQFEDQTMEEEPLSLAAEGEAEYGEEEV